MQTSLPLAACVIFSLAPGPYGTQNVTFAGANACSSFFWFSGLIYAVTNTFLISGIKILLYKHMVLLVRLDVEFLRRP